ncbi:uncharacterized protein VP01_892g4 [Puccinia sorghi]|uniref:Uncharacterized protein n=1 Tax=Puccinia sorghi TaxID=27349 RepID=A0A0L6U8R1_9BASI|nr:uncharacterized protein VP01_892g4 [Puccinia sorghi]
MQAVLRVIHSTKEDGEYLLENKNTIYVSKQRLKIESLHGLRPIVHLKNQLGNSNSFTCANIFSDGTLKTLLFSCTRPIIQLASFAPCWPLNFFHSTISACHLSPPEFIITNKELALMNAIEQVIIDIIQICCNWHIKKSIPSNASLLKFQLSPSSFLSPLSLFCIPYFLISYPLFSYFLSPLFPFLYLTDNITIQNKSVLIN